MNNIYSFFKFLEEKKGKKIPFKYKLLYTPEDIEEEDLVVEGDLDLSDMSITSLPDNLKVGLSIIVNGTELTSIPNNLIVRRHMYARETPLSRKYTGREIRKMVRERGGEVRGSIIT